MRQTGYFVAVLAVCAGLAAAKPTIAEKTGVRLPAAVSEPGTIARGAVFVVTGTELGPEETLQAELPYGQELGGISLAFTAVDESAVVPAYIVSASATQIVAILPSSATAGDYNVTVTYNGEVSEPFAARIADRNLGLVTVDGQPGSGVVAQARAAAKAEEEEEAEEGTEPEPEPEPVTVGFTAPLRPGWRVVVEAAGLGAIDTPDNELAPEANMVEEALVVLGGVEIPVTYLGRNPAKPGYDLVAFVMPDSDVPAGCTVDLVVKIGDVVTAHGVIPVAATADDATCTHPLGLTPEGLRTLDAGGTVTIGHFAILQQAVSATVEGLSLDIRTETLSGAFERHNAATLAQYMGSSGAGWLANPVGCTVWTAAAVDAPVPAVEAVDAGELWIQGPGGLDKAVPKVLESNIYNVMLTPVAAPSIPGLPTIPGMPTIPGLPNIPGLPGAGPAASGVQKGVYTLSGKGGEVVGEFSAEANVADPIVWTNKNDASMTTIDRGADLTFLWTGAGNDGDLATAVGLSRGPAPENTDKVVVRTFICFAPASAGSLVVPAAILAQMPANPGDNFEFPGTVALQHTSGTANLTRLQAPLADGGSTEPGTFTFAYGTTKMASFQ